MSESNHIRERLLEMSDVSGDRHPARAKYESEMKAMIEQTLSTRRRVFHAIAGVLTAGFGVLVLTGVLGDENLPWLVQMVGWFTVAGTAAWAALHAMAAIRGRWRRRTYSQLAIFIAGVMLAGMGLVFLRVAAEGDPRWDNQMLETTGWVFLGLLAVSVLMHYMEEQQLKTQAKLLELELRLAEISERLGKQ